MEDNQKPGIGGEEFKIRLDAGWGKIVRLATIPPTIDFEKLTQVFRQHLGGSQDIIDRMVNRYNRTTGN